MAQGAANPNYMHRLDIPMGGYQNQPFIPKPSGNMGYPWRNHDPLAAQVEAMVQRLVGDNSRKGQRQIGQKPYPEWIDRTIS